MHPLDITESDRWGDPLVGMEPLAPLGAHARRAFDRVLGWLRDRQAGKPVRTRTGDPRVMPYTLRIMARQYVDDHLHKAAFDSEAAWQYAHHYYVFALEVELGNILEALAVQDDAEWPPEYHALVVCLRLEDGA